MTVTQAFWRSSFDKICLLCMLVFLICLLVYTDKHSNNDLVKWLETFATGFGGAYLGMLTQQRLAASSPTNGNGNGNGLTNGGGK
jgi:hypothetical protein